MADDTRQVQEVILGKKWSTEKFSTVKSAEAVAEEAKLQEDYAHENAIPLTVYFQIRGHNDSVLQRMLESYTKVRTAKLEAFDKIFEKFFG